jgi:hypothetical protein
MRSNQEKSEKLRQTCPPPPATIIFSIQCNVLQPANISYLHGIQGAKNLLLFRVVKPVNVMTLG